MISNIVSERAIINNSGFMSRRFLFLVYVNDIYYVIDVKYRLFLDDACLSFQHSDPDYVNNIINKELCKLGRWLCSNRLFINYTKTKCLLFNRISKKCKFNVMLKGFFITVKVRNIWV